MNACLARLPAHGRACASKKGRWLGFAVFATAVALICSQPANANFISFTGDDPACSGNDCFLFLGSAVTGTGSNSLSATVGGATGPAVNIATNVNVTSGAGFAVLRPASDEALTNLTFTPVNDLLFGDFSFRGILDDPGDVTINVTDAGGVLFSHVFSIATNGNFQPIGMISKDGQSIKSVSITSAGFKDVRQIEFSPVSPVPIPPALALFGSGLVGLSFLSRRRGRKQSSREA